MKEDKILIVGMIGVFSTIPAEIITWIGKLLGFSKYSDYQLSSFLITINKPSITLGFVVQASVGIIVSIVLYQVLNYMGKEHVLIKATAIGILSWVVLEVIITAMLEGRTISLREVSGYYTHLFGAIGFGIIQGLLLKRLIFREAYARK